MKTQLTFIEPLAYTTNGIVIYGHHKEAIRFRLLREYAPHSPTRYQMIIMDTGQICDLTYEQCDQIDKYIQYNTPTLPEEMFTI